jgi:hypothetical protein
VIGETGEPQDARVLRQPQDSDLIDRLFAGIR